MKYLVIAAVICIAVTSPGGPTNYGSDLKHKSNSSPQSPVTFVDNSTHTAQSDLPREKVPEAKATIEWSNWALVVVGALTGCAVMMQARESAKATKVMGDSLKVTVAENRPWLLPQMGEGSDRIQEPFLKPVGTMPQEEMRLSHCIFYLKNYGKTPAKALSLKAELRIGGNSSEPPSSDIYEIGKLRFNPYVFPQGEPLAQCAELSPGGFVTEVELDDINKGVRFLWLRGIIRYRHTIDAETVPDYETRFCYLWETRLNSPKPSWRLAGPPEGNSAT